MGYVSLTGAATLKVSVKKVYYVTTAIQNHPGIALYQFAQSIVFNPYIQPIRLQALSEISELYEERNITAVGYIDNKLYSYQMRVIGMSEYREPNIEKLISVNYPNCKTYPVQPSIGSGIYFSDYDGLPTLVSVFWGGTGGWKVSTRVGMFYSWIHRITGLESRP